MGLTLDVATARHEGTLGVILGVKQTGLGKVGLQQLIDKYGLP